MAKKALADIPYLLDRDGRYYARVVIPVRLRPYLDKMHLVNIANTVKKVFGVGASQKAYLLTDASAFELFAGVPNIAGAHVTSASALRIPAVLHAVQLIAENCGSAGFVFHENATAQ